MTEQQIDQQVLAIREVLSEATKTKESALKFLRDAGILDLEEESMAEEKEELIQKPDNCLTIIPTR